MQIADTQSNRLNINYVMANIIINTISRKSVAIKAGRIRNNLNTLCFVAPFSIFVYTIKKEKKKENRMLLQNGFLKTEFLSIRVVECKFKIFCIPS